MLVVKEARSSLPPSLPPCPNLEGAWSIIVWPMAGHPPPETCSNPIDFERSNASEGNLALRMRERVYEVTKYEHEHEL